MPPVPAGESQGSEVLWGVRYVPPALRRECPASAVICGSVFLANMFHELRTSLNAIIGFSEVVSERLFGELNAKQEEYLKDIQASGKHLLSLINDILDLFQIEAGRMELELADLYLAATLDKERELKQVLLNLLSNGIKSAPGDGRIDVRAVPRDASVDVSVSDTGAGIAPEDLEAIFEELRQVGTADKKVEGTGLGLAMSRRFSTADGSRSRARWEAARRSPSRFRRGGTAEARRYR